MSTLHTTNAVETIGRMFDMGAEPYLVGGVLLGSLAQRLVRLNCGKCRQPYKPTAEEILLLKFSPAELESGKFMKGAGCAECKNTGYKGRMAITEILVVDERLRELMLSGASTSQLARAAVESGMSTLRDCGLQAIFSGSSTVEEVLRETGGY
jgi:type II secretory ATPase GspE/PulE/Tfp pilus assembly ATPase PilB-like protein